MRAAAAFPTYTLKLVEAHRAPSDKGSWFVAHEGVVACKCMSDAEPILFEGQVLQMYLQGGVGFEVAEILGFRVSCDAGCQARPCNCRELQTL